MARTIVKAVVAVVVGAVAVGVVVVGAVVPGLMGQRRCQLPGLESRAGGGAGALAGVVVVVVALNDHRPQSTIA